MEKKVPSFLYHYTSINTLGLILKHKSLRFNNLTAMDDLDEAAFGGKNWGEYCFVSSWTEDGDESIPMWNMYSSNMRGVRVKMKACPFVEDDYGFQKCSFPPKDIFNTEYVVAPSEQNNILFKVEYDDIEYEKTIKGEDIFRFDGSRMEFSGDRLGKWKNRYWDFQKEWRYIMLIYPIGFANTFQNPIRYNQQLQDFMKLANLPFSDYYLSLSEEAIDTMEVVLGPRTNEIDFEIVQMLANKYNPGMKIKESVLSGKIR